MGRCPACGEDVSSTMRFCPACGRTLAHQQGYCTACHDVREATSGGTCTACGHLLVDVRAVTMAPSRTPVGNRGRRSVAVPLLAALALVLAAVAVVALVTRPDDGEAGGAAPASTAPTTSAATLASTAVATTPTRPVPPGVEQYRPVTVVSGSPLPTGSGANDPAIGQVAPVVEGQSFDGSPVVVEPGAPTLLVFGAHWCPHCQVELPRLQAWADSGAMPEGLRLVAISTGVDPGGSNYPPSAWFEEIGWSSPVLADDQTGGAGRAFGLQYFPTLMAIDADGVVRGRVAGELTDDQLGQFLAATLGPVPSGG